MDDLADLLARRLDEARASIERFGAAPRVDLLGRVERIGDDVASVSGLPETRLGEILMFERSDRGGQPAAGIALTLDTTTIGCAMLAPGGDIDAGARVRGTATVASVPVGPALLGRVVNALGIAIDGGAALEPAGFEPVEKPAPSIVDRDFVSESLHTGILAIDAMLAIGRGQRELVIGDREVGKTAIALDTIISQRDSDVICVYCAVGQKTSSVSQVIDAVKRYGAPERCIFIVSAPDDPPGLQWLAPYAACTMAEYFSSRGGDALMIIDDLTAHAVIYRQLSLLLRNPPGREAYPGDIFYIHSRLLERAARLARNQGGGSLTAIPIASTEEGNLSAYIPTNLISITDGQIVLEPRLFHEGQKPAINVGKSVSRVGGKSQPPAIRTLSERMRLEYAQFLELEIFTRFGGMLDDRTRRIIEHGRRIRAVLTQPQYAPLTLADEVALLLALNEGILDRVAVEEISETRASLCGWLRAEGAAHAARINSTGDLDDGAAVAIRKYVSATVDGSGPAPPPRK